MNPTVAHQTFKSYSKMAQITRIILASSVLAIIAFNRVLQVEGAGPLDGVANILGGIGGALESVVGAVKNTVGGVVSTATKLVNPNESSEEKNDPPPTEAACVNKTLSDEEKELSVLVANKVENGEPLTEDEINQLLEVEDLCCILKLPPLSTLEEYRELVEKLNLEKLVPRLRKCLIKA